MLVSAPASAVLVASLAPLLAVTAAAPAASANAAVVSARAVPASAKAEPVSAPRTQATLTAPPLDSSVELVVEPPLMLTPKF